MMNEADSDNKWALTKSFLLEAVGGVNCCQELGVQLRESACLARMRAWIQSPVQLFFGFVFVLTVDKLSVLFFVTSFVPLCVGPNCILSPPP